MDLRDEEESPISRTAGGDQILGIKETITSGGQKRESWVERKKKVKKKNAELRGSLGGADGFGALARGGSPLIEKTLEIRSERRTEMRS